MCLQGALHVAQKNSTACGQVEATFGTAEDVLRTACRDKSSGAAVDQLAAVVQLRILQRGQTLLHELSEFFRSSDDFMMRRMSAIVG
jgi:hypothetical protein